MKALTVSYEGMPNEKLNTGLQNFVLVSSQQLDNPNNIYLIIVFTEDKIIILNSKKIA